MTPGKAIDIEQERLQKALEAAGVGTWDYDFTTETLVWSQRSLQLYGLRKDRPHNNETFLATLHPEDREKVMAAIGAAMDPEGAGQYDIAYRAIGLDDGQLRWLKATGRVYFNDRRTPIRFTGILIDITRQKMAELELTESELRFRRMADGSPVIQWITDAAGNCTYLNKRWSDFTGQSTEEGLGQGWLQMVHPEDLAHTGEKFVRANEDKSAFQMDYRMRTKDGSYRWAFANALPRFDANGSYLGFIGSIVDITDRKLAEEELQFRTALLEAQMESTTSGLLTVDTKGKMLAYNKRFAELWDMPQEIIDNRDDQAALAHAMTQIEDPEGFINRVNYLYQNPKIDAVDEVLFKSGKILERNGRPVIGTDGTYYGWLWQFQDVTERRAVQKELELRTALLEAQNEASPLGLLVINAEKEVYFFNKQYTELFRIPEYLVNTPNRKGLLDFFRETLVDYDQFLDRINLLYNQSETVSRDELHTKDGRIIERFGFPIRGKEGKNLGWTWQFREITSQRQAEESLQQKNKELEALIQEFKFVTDFMPQMVWSTQPDGYHDFYNKQWYDYTGMDYDTTKDKGWSLVLHPDDAERTWKVWRHSLETGAVYEIEYRMRRYDGAYRWFLGRAIPMRNQEGKILKWFGTCTDIHEQKTMSDLLEQKVAERTLEIQEINKNLERSNKELEQFAYVASHDLQEPLRKIRTFTNMLEFELKQPNLGKTAYYIDRIGQSSSRMQELIKDLLDFSRLNRSHQDVFELLDLNEVVQQVTEDLELLIAQKSATIHFDPLPTVCASSLQMSQLFYNLISNALKFARPDTPPEVTITCAPASEELLHQYKLAAEYAPFIHLQVADNGIGFEPEHAEQIFTIFQRLHSRAAYEGTGIGLALCKRVAQNHHGDIFATSIPGTGSVFHVLLPAEKKGKSEAGS